MGAEVGGFSLYRAHLDGDGRTLNPELLFTYADMPQMCNEFAPMLPSIGIHRGIVYVSVTCLMETQSVWTFDPALPATQRWSRIISGVDISVNRVHVDDDFVYLAASSTVSIETSSSGTVHGAIIRYPHNGGSPETIWDQKGSIYDVTYGEHHVCFRHSLALLSSEQLTTTDRQVLHAVACGAHEILLCKDKRTSVGDTLLRVAGKPNMTYSGAALSKDRLFWLTRPRGHATWDLRVTDLPEP